LLSPTSRDRILEGFYDKQMRCSVLGSFNVVLLPPAIIMRPCFLVKLTFHNSNVCKVWVYLVATFEMTVSNLIGDFGFMLKTPPAKLSHSPVVQTLFSFVVVVASLNWDYELLCVNPTVKRIVTCISPWSMG
jgi:hypothetical protein